MVRKAYYDKNGVKKGAWSKAEDDKLRAYVLTHGHSNWRQLPEFAGLSRCGKSCRLRWMNYLRPDLKHGNCTQEEEDTIIRLHKQLGNKWSVIAANLPGRTDNEIKNYWHTHLKKHAKKNSTFTQMQNFKANPINVKNKVIDHQSGADTPPLPILESCPLSPTVTCSMSTEHFVTSFDNDHQSGVDTPPLPILESCPLFPTATCSTSTEHFVTSFDNDHHVLSILFKNYNVNHNNVASSEQLDQTCVEFSGDFWTQPFAIDQDTYSSSLPNLEISMSPCNHLYYTDTTNLLH